MKRLGLLIVLVMIASLLATCGPTPEPQVIEKIVTQEVEKQVTQVVTVKETVIVAGTPQVQEKEVVVTATPVAREPVVLRLPITSDPEGTLEPGLTVALVTGWLAENLHAGLLKFDEDTNITPYIAESWEVSDDGLTYTFHLRDDALWHNGRPIVAEDFKKGWERYLDPNVAAQAGPEYLDSIVGADEILDGSATELAGVEVVDDHTLKITTKQTDPGFLMRMATPFAWVVPSEAVVEGQPQWVDQPVGAGPFKFVEWRTNDRIILEANDDFFLGRPTVDRIEYFVVPDPATQLAMYEAGELDITPVEGADLRRISEDPAMSKELKFWTRAQLLYYGLNMYKDDVFKDVRVRQAFNYAFDKSEIIDKILFNAYEPATGLVPPGIPEYNPKLKGYEYDPQKAQQLMADAGYPGGAGFPPMQVSSDSRSATEMEAFAAQVGENLGINIEVNVVERGEMITGLWGHDSWDIFRWGWTADMPTAEVWTYQLLYGGLDSNFFGYDNPEFNAILDQARTTMDEAQRISLWQQAEEIAVQEAAMVPFGYSQYIYLVKPYVKGITFNLNGPMWYKYVQFEK